MQKFKMLINGQWVDARSGKTFPSYNPTTGQPWAEIPRADQADAEAAVESAHEAFCEGPWSRMNASQRGAALVRLSEIIAANAEHLAQIETRDNGKLINEMSAQLNYVPQWYRYFGGLADKIEGSVIPSDKPGVFNYTRHEPLGVIAAITPWNSPILLTTWKLAPALAAGNTVVIKPSEHASAAILEMARLFEEAGLPPGVVNVITGFGNEVGSALVSHPKVAKTAFTGGEAGGRAVYKLSADKLGPVTLELGGKSPNIVFDDVDLDKATNGVISGIFAASGQTCIAGSRLLLQESIKEPFMKLMLEKIQAAKIGDPSSTDTQVGPMTTKEQLDKVLKYIDIAQAEGAKCVCGGKLVDDPALAGGWFVQPTIFTNVTNDMTIAQEEVFGPVLSVITFKTDEEALQIANDSPYGLAAGVWTENIERIFSFCDKLKAGTVWVNMYRAVSYMSPFGGYKRSGLGRESGKQAIMEYLQTKCVWINISGRVGNPFVIG